MKNSIRSLPIVFFALVFFAFFHSAYAATNSYTVKAGDSLSDIAQTVYGDASKWDIIAQANASLIPNPNLIYAGEVLSIPQSTNQQPTSQVQTTSVVVTSGNSNDPTILQSVQEKNVPKQLQPSTVVLSNQNMGQVYYKGIIQSAAAEYGIDPLIMEKIIECESGFNPNAYNPSGATGIAQFMPGTYYGSWNVYKSQYPLSSPIGQIYAMALKIHEGDIRAWSCASIVL